MNNNVPILLRVFYYGIIAMGIGIGAIIGMILMLLLFSYIGIV